MQQGGSPSPFDRNYGTKIAARAVDMMIKQVDECTGPDGKQLDSLFYEFHFLMFIEVETTLGRYLHWVTTKV